MSNGLFYAHSGLRYLVLLFLVAVIVKSLLGLINKKPFGGLDDKLSLILLIVTHLQLVAGIVLYFVRPTVRLGPGAMSNEFRYWTVEHPFGMLIAIALITVARISSKKMTSPEAKHKRLFIFNSIALLIIVTIVYLSGRGIF